MYDTIQYVPLKDILIDNDFNCRGAITPLSVVELARSIQELGLKQPIILTEMSPEHQTKFGKKYKLVAGFRRYMAHIVNRMPTIRSLIEATLTDKDARIINLTENLDREELNILQEARALEEILKCGSTLDEIAEKLHKPIPWITVRRNLLALPEDIQQEAASGVLTQYHIKDLYDMRRNTDDMYSAVRKIKDAKMRNEKTVRVRPVKPITKKRRRDQAELLKAINYIMIIMKGPSLASRALAWAAGTISDLDFYLDLQKWCTENGIKFDIPKIAITNMEAKELLGAY